MKARHIVKAVRRSRRTRRQTLPGAPPGTIAPAPESPKPKIEFFTYNESQLSEHKIERVEELEKLRAEGMVGWLNIDGLGDAEAVRKIGEMFNLHRLALEDVVNVHQRPKIEEYGEWLFVTARMAHPNQHFETEQVSFFLREDFLISFQELAGGDPFEPVRERLRKSRGKLRSRRADYLLYSLLDSIIDAYFPVLEHYSDALEDVEYGTITNPDNSVVRLIHELKQDLQVMRRVIWPLREVINAILRDSTMAFQEDSRLGLRDCYDHTVQIIEIIESHRDLCSDLMDIYLSILSNRMNEIMKVLATIATIFMPITFIAGVYGMNFDPDKSPFNMPELEWYWGYPFAMGLMGLSTVILLLLFRKRRWI